MDFTLARTTQFILDTFASLDNDAPVCFYDADGKQHRFEIIARPVAHDPHFEITVTSRSARVNLTVADLRNTLSNQPKRIPLVFLTDDEGSALRFALWVERNSNGSRRAVLAEIRRQRGEMPLHPLTYLD